MDINLIVIDSKNKYNIYPFNDKQTYIDTIYQNFELRDNTPATLNNNKTDVLYYFNGIEAVSEHLDDNGYHTIQLYIITDSTLTPIIMNLPSTT